MSCKSKIVGFIILAVLVALPYSCKENPPKDTITLYQCPMHCEGDKTYEEPQKCPTCKMDLQPVEPKVVAKNDEEIPSMSIYNLPSHWRNQDNRELTLLDLKGDVLVMVMIYTSCTAACPRLVADMRNIYKEIPNNQKEGVKMVFVSIDPLTDTPEALKAFAEENQMEGEQWVFLTGTEADTREFAAVLAVSYKQISPIDFSHSNIISVFDKKGIMVYQQEGLGVSNVETITQITNATEQ